MSRLAALLHESFELRWRLLVMKTPTSAKDDGLLTVVTRAFILSSPNESLGSVTRLGEQPGVLRVKAAPDGRKLTVTYDVRKITADGIDQALRSRGALKSRTLLESVRIAWLNALDENCRDNAAYRPACCSKPPPGSASSRLRKPKK
jgi:hypothetical protein